jgi:predicted transcriptional regulator
MSQVENILISVEHNYVLKMLNGVKTAEIRRRRLRIDKGTRVWVYSKLPRGYVELVATVDAVVVEPPWKLWRLYEERIAITSAEFKTYFRGIDVGCAILLRNITALHPALELNILRRTARNFQPPQFFKRLVPHGPEMKSFASFALT